MYIEQEDILKHISAKPFHLISEAADELGVEAYVIGGYVRDIFLHRPSKDIDVDRKSTRLNSSHQPQSRMPSSA